MIEEDVIKKIKRHKRNDYVIARIKSVLDVMFTFIGNVFLILLGIGIIVSIIADLHVIKVDNCIEVNGASYCKVES